MINQLSYTANTEAILNPDSDQGSVVNEALHSAIIWAFLHFGSRKITVPIDNNHCSV